MTPGASPAPELVALWQRYCDLHRAVTEGRVPVAEAVARRDALEVVDGSGARWRIAPESVPGRPPLLLRIPPGGSRPLPATPAEWVPPGGGLTVSGDGPEPAGGSDAGPGGGPGRVAAVLVDRLRGVWSSLPGGRWGRVGAVVAVLMVLGVLARACAGGGDDTSRRCPQVDGVTVRSGDGSVLGCLVDAGVDLQVLIDAGVVAPGAGDGLEFDPGRPVTRGALEVLFGVGDPADATPATRSDLFDTLVAVFGEHLDGGEPPADGPARWAGLAEAGLVDWEPGGQARPGDPLVAGVLADHLLAAVRRADQLGIRVAAVRSGTPEPDPQTTTTIGEGSGPTGSDPSTEGPGPDTVAAALDALVSGDPEALAVWVPGVDRVDVAWWSAVFYGFGDPVTGTRLEPGPLAVTDDGTWVQQVTVTGLVGSTRATLATVELSWRWDPDTGRWVWTRLPRIIR